MIEKLRDRGIQLGFAGLGYEEVEGLTTNIQEPTKAQLIDAHAKIIIHLRNQGSQNPVIASFDWDSVGESLVSQQIRALEQACHILRLPVAFNRVTQHFDSDSGRITVDRLEISRRIPPRYVQK